MDNLQDKYTLLKSPKQDVELVRQYASLVDELSVTRSHLQMLEKLEKKHRSKLQDEIWTTGEGKVMAIADMETSHISNAMRLIRSKGKAMPERLVEEAQSRQLAIPAIGSMVIEEDEYDIWL